MSSTEAPVCRRCDREVRVSCDSYEIFERMHYICFHLEFEHDPADPDERCADPGCPWVVGAGGEASH